MSEMKDVRVKALQDAVDALKPAAEATGGHFAVALEKVQGLLDEAIAASPSGEEVGRALRAIAEGYRVHGERDRYVVVENPEFKPDDGSNPCICIDVSALTSPEAPQASDVVRELLEAARGIAFQSIRRMRAAGVDCLDLTNEAEKFSHRVTAYKRSTTDGQS